MVQQAAGAELTQIAEFILQNPVNAEVFIVRTFGDPGEPRHGEKRRCVSGRGRAGRVKRGGEERSEVELEKLES